MHNTVHAFIDLAALRHNLALVRALCPRSKIMAMVKADAYGHGLLQVARALSDVDGLAVARLDEALQLRRAGISQRILLLGSLLDDDDLALCAAQQIDVTVHDMATVLRIVNRSQPAPLRIWLKLDSGMHRLGLTPEDFATADRLLRDTPAIDELLHFTHLSSAEELSIGATDQQLTVFSKVHATTYREATDLENLNHAARNAATHESAISIANSAALITRVATHHEWIRPGIMLYGENPVSKSHPLPLRPVMTLNATVIALRRLPVGEAVGYNRTWISQRDSIIATIGIGYGDGYPRHAKNGTPVWIDGQRAPLVGRVSMDSITVDVTDCKKVAVGDIAQLWGPHLSATVVAEFAETISYELFTSIGHRVPRTYSDD